MRFVMSAKLKKNDEVMVIAGKDSGKRGKILALDKGSNRVIVEGINKRKKYVKTAENPSGVLIEKEFPINLSNVMFFCDKCKKGTRVGIELTEKSKTRICKSCSKSIDK